MVGEAFRPSFHLSGNLAEHRCSPGPRRKLASIATGQIPFAAPDAKASGSPDSLQKVGSVPACAFASRFFRRAALPSPRPHSRKSIFSAAAAAGACFPLPVSGPSPHVTSSQVARPCTNEIRLWVIRRSGITSAAGEQPIRPTAGFPTRTKAAT